ncbi:transcriptional regulator [Saccharopolyspora gloriosae]|uniref:transcriptional regulator n=1 Tax=Saccharopolyspora gloriosae TaxID=455344 RepID=UPI001FB78956|nr:transcriptional regulator [Saccharopolyspora gloriosae]
MLREFPPPPRADEISNLIKKRLAEARESGGVRETVTVDWNQQPLHVEVLELPLSELFFNPATHRIRAQRSHDPERDKALDNDPYSESSQEYLKFLLQAEPANPAVRDPNFDHLKESLHEFGQNDPGLITYHGIVVNGNTRAAALREIGAQSMRVGILPESFTWADINAVELSLQLRKDHRREYSYINRLLAMEEQAALGRTPETIAKEFRIRVNTLQQERWILGVIRDLIERSKTEYGASLELIDFEDHQEKFKELHRAHEKLAASDPDRAEVFKETRLSSIMLGFAKTDVRHIEDGSFPDTYLQDALPSQLNPHGSAEDAVSIPGLGMAIPGASSAVSSARALSDRVLRAKATAKAVSAEVGEDEKKDAQATFDQLKVSFDSAIDKAGRDMRVRKRKQLAPARLVDACADIDQCVVELVQARAARALDEEAFDDAVVKLRDSVRKLAQQAGRGISNPGDGVSWLLDAAASRGVS